MKFIKQNLTLVICAAVVILSIASIFYPFGFWKEDVRTAAAARYNTASGDIHTLVSAKLSLPGVDKLTGVPTQNLLDFKRNLNKTMDEQAAAINKYSAEANRSGRVEMDATNGHVTPLLEGKEGPKREVNFLPVILHDESADAMAFKDDYRKIFDVWAGRLVGSHVTPVPPRSEELTADYADYTAKRNANLPPSAQQNNQPGNDQRAELEFRRQKIMDTAVGIDMYVDPGAFQVRPWLNTESPPTEQMMFEALVDSWFQGDVVAAIASVNDDALKAVKDPKDKNVGASPVKRLMHITVGNDALTTHLGTWGGQTTAGGNSGPSTSLFFLPSMTLGAAADPSMAAAPAAGAAQPNTTDLSRSMTGRASGADYDVVLMQISIDIDPSYLNKFIDQLYRRNMGYTVLSVKSRTIDPLDRAGNGFIYGETQVAEVELLVEGLLFRNWTQPIMPDAIRAQLGIPPDAKK